MEAGLACRDIAEYWLRGLLKSDERAPWIPNPGDGENNGVDADGLLSNARVSIINGIYTCYRGVSLLRM